MPTEFPNSLTVDDVTLALVVERKAVKNINARLRNGTMYVSVPQRAARPMVETALVELARRLLRRQRARQINGEDDALALAQRVARRFPQPLDVRGVTFSTEQSSCWGSYSSRTRSIRLNAALRHMPPWVLEAVVAHELAHAVHADHSPAFWALLRQVYPDTDKANAFLQGVAWLAHNWDELPPVERAQLTQEMRD